MSHIKQFDEYYKNTGQTWLSNVDDYYIRLYYNERNQRICEIVSELMPIKILDIGCGSGDLTYLLARPYRMVIGLEPSIENIKKYEKNTDLPIMEGFAEAIPIETKNAGFDLVVMADVIEHVETPIKAILEASRMLRTNGHILITTPNRYAENFWNFFTTKRFRKQKVKDDVFSPIGLELLANRGSGLEIVSHTLEGYYPRAKLMSWMGNKYVVKLLSKISWLGYRQYMLLKKIF